MVYKYHVLESFLDLVLATTASPCWRASGLAADVKQIFKKKKAMFPLTQNHFMAEMIQIKNMLYDSQII